jgi:hypothetical protein
MCVHGRRGGRCAYIYISIYTIYVYISHVGDGLEHGHLAAEHAALHLEERRVAQERRLAPVPALQLQARHVRHGQHLHHTPTPPQVRGFIHVRLGAKLRLGWAGLALQDVQSIENSRPQPLHIAKTSL